MTEKEIVYDWEYCILNSGKKGMFWIDDASEIASYSLRNVNERSNWNLVPTEKDAEKVLAYTRLLTIINKINADFPSKDKGFKYYPYILDGLVLKNDMRIECPNSTISFESKEGFNAFKSVPENVKLLKTFFDY